MKGQKELCDLLWGIESKEDLYDALGDLLTPSEIEAIGERIQVFMLLKKGMPHRKIATSLGVSITTVSRGAKVLKYGNGFVDKYI